MTGGWRRQRGGPAFGFPVPIPHVEVHQVVPVPTVDCEDNEDEEIRGEGQGFSERHEDSVGAGALVVTLREPQLNQAFMLASASAKGQQFGP